ncbi:archease [Candidatus Aminicenantes bacterium AC-334-K16]|jgi:SHS2 domain-containing protein|nr:archease [Candidatus Aminicenantes bacterium AC-334-K16]
MEKFKFLPHTADAKFQAFGRTLEEAFAHAALAVCHLMWEPQKIKPVKEILVEVSGRDLKQLLVSFLEEILYQFETREFLLSRVEDVRIEERAEPPGYWLLARFKGNRMRKGDEIFGDVKAITYNEMEITQGPDGVFIQVVVDI